MIFERWLCNFKYKSVKTDTSLSGLKSAEGDFKVNELSHRVNQAERNGLVVTAYKDMIRNIAFYEIDSQENADEGYKSTIIFAADIQHVLTLTELFRCHSISCAAIHSMLSTTERQHNINLFSQGSLSVLINCGILTEGVDIPRIDSIMIARPTKSTILLQQMLGRGLRLFEGKDHCLVVDFEDVIDRKQILATIPQLMGKDADFDFDGVDALTIAEELHFEKGSIETSDEEQKHFEGPIKVKVVDHGFIVDLSQTSIEDYKHQSETPYKWVRTSPTELSICVQKNRYLMIVEEQGKFTIYLKFFMMTHDRKFFWKKMALGKPSTLTQAFTNAQVWISEKFGPVAMTLYRNAPWRTHDPSEAQLVVLSKRMRTLVILREEDGEYFPVTDMNFVGERHFLMMRGKSVKGKLKPTRLTKGMASDLILKATLSGRAACSAFKMTSAEANVEIQTFNRNSYS